MNELLFILAVVSLCLNFFLYHKNKKLSKLNESLEGEYILKSKEYVKSVPLKVFQEDNKKKILAEDSLKILYDVINTIPVRVFWKDLDGNYLGANTLFVSDTNKDSIEEVIGANDYALFKKEDAQLYRADDRSVIQNNTPKINYEEPQTRQDSDEVSWLSTSKIPLQNTKGEIYGVLGTYEDITKRKNDESNLLKVNESLRSTIEKVKENQDDKLDKALKNLDNVNEKLTESYTREMKLKKELEDIKEKLQQVRNTSES